MFKSILSILIFISILFSAIFESVSEQSISENIEQEIRNELTISIINTISNSDCDDCEEKECSDHEGNCAHHCFGNHNITASSNDIFLAEPKTLSKLNWNIAQKYNNPSKKSALKPPLLVINS